MERENNRERLPRASEHLPEGDERRSRLCKGQSQQATVRNDWQAPLSGAGTVEETRKAEDLPAHSSVGLRLPRNNAVTSETTSATLQALTAMLEAMEGYSGTTGAQEATVIRNALHLGLGQIATTVLGIMLVAALGRSFGAADFGVYYIVITIWTFTGVVAIDWGQSTYIVRETARGRSDEAEFIGTALLLRTLGWCCATVLAAGIAIVSGYDQTIVMMAPLMVIVSLPLVLSQPFGHVFRGKERMDLDAITATVCKALTLIATLPVLAFGGGVFEVIFASGVGGIGALIAGLYLARQLGLKVSAPSLHALKEQFWIGAPIAALMFLLLVQPLVDVWILSFLTAREVVGWYGATRSILGIINSSAMILVTASFPKMSRMAGSLPDLRQLLASNSRLLLIVGSLAASALYLFADTIVWIIYSHRHFEQSVPILRAAAVFLPLMFLGYAMGNAVIVLGRTKEMTLVKMIAIAIGAAISWPLVGYCQSRFGNGAIGIAIAAGAVEILVVVAFASLLPRGAVSGAILLDLIRAFLTAACAALPLSTLQPLSLLVSAPLFAITFLAAAMATRLIVPADLTAAISIIRTLALRRSQT